MALAMVIRAMLMAGMVSFCLQASGTLESRVNRNSIHKDSLEARQIRLVVS
jgi:hypothetical protein